MKKNILFLLLWMFGLAAFTQNSTLSGTILNNENTPVQFAKILIKETNRFAQSDDQGRFRFENIKNGNYTIRISAAGYEPYEQRVGVSGYVEIPFYLEPGFLELKSVMVTAEKRSEQLQKVPGSVTAIESSKVKSLQISNVNELGKITPNFKTYDDGGSIFPLVSTRGILTIDSSPIIGMYADGVPLFNTASFPSFMNDIERIEILKGPQGTLYGRNALAGVVNIITKKPTNVTNWYVTTGYGNLNQIKAAAGVNLPLVKNKLFLRLNGAYTKRDGYIENTYNNETNLLGRSVFSGGLKLSFYPSERLNFKLISNIESRENAAYAFIGGFGTTANLIDSLVQNHPYTVSQNVEGVYLTDMINNALKINVSGEKLRFDAITAYQYTSSIRQGDDFDFSIFDLNEVVNSWTDLHTISEELRFSSVNDKSKLQWIGGVFGYYTSNNRVDRIRAGADNAMIAPDPETAAQYPYTDIDSSLVKKYGFSVFGQATYAISEKLNLTAGVRYELEKSSLTTSKSYRKNGNPLIYPALGLFPASFDLSTQFGAFSPKGVISYDIKEDIMAYGSVARGYRPGGVNAFVDDPEKAAFNPEYSWNYEIGLKTKFWKNRAKVNLTGFYISYEDQQLFTLVDLNTFQFGQDNVGNSTSFGVELESNVLLFKGLEAYVNVGYLETEITRYEQIGFFGPIDNVGNEQPFAPRWNGSSGFSYTFKLSDKWKTRANVDYEYQSDVFIDVENTAVQKAYGLLNSRIDVGNKKLNFGLWGKNLLNKTFLSYGYSVAASGIFGSYGMPLTFGADLTLKF